MSDELMRDTKVAPSIIGEVSFAQSNLYVESIQEIRSGHLFLNASARNYENDARLRLIIGSFFLKKRQFNLGKK